VAPSRTVFVAAVCSLAVLLPRAAAAQHITIAGGVAGAHRLAGPNYLIGPSLGKQVGGNLFDSFLSFGVGAGQSATFTAPATVNNIIAGVTGGSPSAIDGSIKSGANLYLINPAGVVFGPHATVNVAGSFYASTANYLKLGRDGRFAVTHPDGSKLTTAPPAAFGFLNAKPAKITADGSTLISRGAIGLVGGPVAIRQGATIEAPAGTTDVVSVAGEGEVPVDPRNGAALSVKRFGKVAVAGAKTVLDVSNKAVGGHGGSVFVRSGTLRINAGTIDADNYGTGPGGKLLLRGDNAVMLSDGAVVHAAALASGSGADIVLRTGPVGTISIDNSFVLVDSDGAGDAGNLTVAGARVSLTDVALLLSNTGSAGNGGAISVTAGTSLTIDGAAALAFTGIGSAVEPGATGNGGAINLRVGGALSVVEGGVVSSETAGRGNGGPITVTAGAVTMDDALNPRAYSGIFSYVDAAGPGDHTFASPGNGTGRAGNIVVRSGPVTITGGSHLVSGTLPTDISAGQARAGDLSVIATNLTLTSGGSLASTTSGSGNAGTTDVCVSDAILIDGSRSNSFTGIGGPANIGSTGNAGDVFITAGNMSLVRGGQISATTFGPGSGGLLQVDISGRLSLDGSGSIIGAQAGPTATGGAGSVSISANSLSLTGGAEISTGTFGAGSAGSVTVRVADRLTIDGSPATVATGIFSEPEPGSTGNAGAITVNAGNLSIVGRGGISSSALASVGQAGSITVSAGNLSIASNGVIASVTLGSGNGGIVIVDVAGRLTIDGTGAGAQGLTGILADAVSGSHGAAGDINVVASRLKLRGGGEISSSTDGPGAGGSVSVTTPGMLLLEGAGTEIASSSLGTGSAGDVSITGSTLALSHDSAIMAATLGSSHGGNITIDLSGDLSVRSLSRIFTDTLAGGNAGTVSVTAAGAVSIAGTADISSRADPGSSGAAGTVILSAGSLSLARDGVISGSTFGAGNGGSVTVSAGNVSITDGGEISVSTRAGGNGGDVSVVAGSLIIGGGAESGIIALASGSGNAGDIAITAGALTMTPGGAISGATLGYGTGGDVRVAATTVTLSGAGPQIAVESFGAGVAGSIELSAGSLQIFDGAGISAAGAQAAGGNIILSVGNLLYLRQGAITTSSEGVVSNGGNIAVAAPFVILDHSGITANAFGGNGGNITIDAGSYIASTDSIVSASSQKGVSGEVVINGITPLNGALVVLSAELHNPAALTQNSCAARSNQPQSSLAVAGRGGLPQDPNATLPALYIAGRDVRLAPRVGAHRADAGGDLLSTFRLAMRCD
jgi:filamentous hemagglutinin family protein